jgi:hypothetical protein
MGFGRMEIGFDDPRHPNGPSLAIIARKRPRAPAFWRWLRSRRH